MTETQLLKFCLYYKGEALIPLSLDGTDEGKIWQAEKFACESMQNLIDETDPARSFASAVGAYVMKWDPWEADNILKPYFAKLKLL